MDVKKGRRDVAVTELGVMKVVETESPMASARSASKGDAVPSSDEAAPREERKRAEPRRASPATLLLRFLMEKKLIELGPEVTVSDVAVRLEPLLLLIPRKRAIKAGIEFLENDDDVEEIFADDDALKAILNEFVGE